MANVYGRPVTHLFRSRFLLAAILVLSVAPAWAADQPAGVLCKGTRFETPYYLIDSGKPGPLVMVTGGVHGDEPAGMRAAEQIRHWPIRKGRLIVVPRANVPGLAAKSRNIPDEAKESANLNRNFPCKGGPDKPLNAVAEAIWQLTVERKPDWLIDLHEGFDFHKINKKSTGAGLIRTRHKDVLAVSERMLEAVNKTIDEADHELVPMINPAVGSLARAAWEVKGIRAMIQETCLKEPLARRVRQHRIMVHCLLKHLEMVDCDCDLIAPSDRKPGELRVAVYCGGGVGSTGPVRLEGLLQTDRGVLARLVSPEAIRAGVLSQFDAVLFPGGTGKGTAEALGEGGREAVERFVRGGGGYLGICAGAYLATSGYDWGLKIIDAKTVDSRHWKRGKGTVKIELTPAGREILGPRKGELPIYYANGPLLGPGGRDDLQDYTVLSYFRQEMRQNDAPEGVMLNTPAMIAAAYQKGRVALFSPHPEKTAGLEPFVARVIRWTAGRAPQDAGSAPATRRAR